MTWKVGSKFIKFGHIEMSYQDNELPSIDDERCDSRGKG